MNGTGFQRLYVFGVLLSPGRIVLGQFGTPLIGTLPLLIGIRNVLERGVEYQGGLGHLKFSLSRISRYLNRLLIGSNIWIPRLLSRLHSSQHGASMTERITTIGLTFVVVIRNELTQLSGHIQPTALVALLEGFFFPFSNAHLQSRKAARFWAARVFIRFKRRSPCLPAPVLRIAATAAALRRFTSETFFLFRLAMVLIYQAKAWL